VLDETGRAIGEVTCCSIDTEGYRLGQAYLELKHIEEGAPIQVLQGAGEALRKAGSRPTTLAEIQSALAAAGDKKARAPEAAAVLSRFPKKK